MRLQWIPTIILIIVNVIIDVGLLRKALRTKHKGLAIAHGTASVLLLIFMIVTLCTPYRNVNNHAMVRMMWSLYAYFSLYVPKYICLIIYALSLPRFVTPRSKRFIRWCSVAAAILIFVIMWWGALVTPYTYRVEKVTVESRNLPKEFDGYRIVHFSDTHFGTYDGRHTQFVQKYVDAINSLNPDIICFTGDLVSRQTAEAEPYAAILSKLKAKDGIFSILGNHDYDDYMNWPTVEQKMADRERLCQLERNMGWHLLKNQSSIITRGDSRIAIIGTENYGDPPFPKYGRIHKAYGNLNDSTFKILLQHNPYDWNEEITDKTNIDLMLAGHTHAMQVMLNIAGHRMSPARLRYKQWGGLYSEGTQALYVNIGLGMVGMPVRIGATPEITEITLKRITH